MKGMKVVLTVMVSLVLVGVSMADTPAMWKKIKPVAVGAVPAIATAKIYPDSVWFGYHNNQASDWWSKRSVNHGVSWPDSVQVITGGYTAGLRSSELRSNSKGLHLVMTRSYLGYNRIVYARSNDGGSSWPYTFEVTNNGVSPGLAVDPSGVTVVWAINSVIYSRRGQFIPDGGIQWGSVKRVSRNHLDSLAANPQVVTGGNYSYCAYKWGTSSGGYGTVRVRRAPVSAYSWTDVLLPTPTDIVPTSILNPALAMNSQNQVWVVYAAQRTSESNTLERIRCSRVSGTSWSTLSRSSSIGVPFFQRNPRIAFDAYDTMYVCWEDTRNSPIPYTTSDIYYDRSAGGTIWEEWSSSEQYGNRLVSRDFGDPLLNIHVEPDVATSPNRKQHFVWQGPTSDGWRVLYRARDLDVQPPDPPTGLQVLWMDVVEPVWNSVPDGVAYNVYRSDQTEPPFEFRRINVHPVEGTFYYDFSANPNSCYTYYVTALDYADNESVASGYAYYWGCAQGGEVLSVDLGNPEPSPHTVRRTGFYAWGGSPDSTVDYDPDRLVYRVSGLVPDSSYLLGVGCFEVGSSQGRLQSLAIDGVQSYGRSRLLDRPSKLVVLVPKRSYLDGNIELSFAREAGPDAVVSRLWLYKANFKGGGPQSSELGRVVPRNTCLLPPCPNPTSGSAEVRYHLSRPSHVSLVVFDILGRRVKSLVEGTRLSGAYTESWDGRDERGLRARSGVYFVRLQAGGVSAIQRLVLSR